jgi:hypothetical protein
MESHVSSRECGLRFCSYRRRPSPRRRRHHRPAQPRQGVGSAPLNQIPAVSIQVLEHHDGAVWLLTAGLQEANAGLSSGIDGSPYVLSKLQGMGRAKQVALQMEYDWRPESHFARAALADMALWRAGINSTVLWQLNGRTELTEGALPGGIKL